MNYKQSPEYLRMKADQHWEMAGLARQDGDMPDSAQHTDKAREYDRLARAAAAEIEEVIQPLNVSEFFEKVLVGYYREDADLQTGTGEEREYEQCREDYTTAPKTVELTMTIPLSERILTLHEACRFFPSAKLGKPVHVSRLYRYVRVGLQGIRLETIQCGGTRCTSEEAIGRFFAALTARCMQAKPPTAEIEEES